MLLRALFPTLFAGAIVLACSDDEKTPSQLAVEQNAEVLCDRIFSCCTPSDLVDLAYVDEKSPPTRDGCVAFHVKTAAEYAALTDGEAKAGRVATHFDRSGTCIQEQRAESCSELYARLARIHLGDAFALCNAAVVEPLVEDGSPCKLYLDCKSGYCDLGGQIPTDDQVLGTCKPRPTVGGPCGEGGCAEGLRCDPITSSCVPLAPRGGECVSDDACAGGACRGGVCASPGKCGG
jgi:hypothetical protein